MPQPDFLAKIFTPVKCVIWDIVHSLYKASLKIYIPSTTRSQENPPLSYFCLPILFLALLWGDGIVSNFHPEGGGGIEFQRKWEVSSTVSTAVTMSWSMSKIEHNSRCRCKTHNWWNSSLLLATSNAMARKGLILSVVAWRKGKKWKKWQNGPSVPLRNASLVLLWAANW